MAAVSAMLGIILSVAVPFLPVVVDTSVLTWPRGDSTDSVEAPLVAYAPIDFDATIPCPVVIALADAGGGTLLSTAPRNAPNAARYGLVASVSAPDTGTRPELRVVLRDLPVLTITLDRLSDPNCSIGVSSTSESTTTTVDGVDGLAPDVRAGDFRPQMVGVFSDIAGPPPAGLAVTAEVDNRFSSAPSLFKLLAMIVGSLATVVSLAALHRLDNADGRRARRFLPANWRRVGIIDAVVVATLGVWHVIGANTADDGYLLGMARASEPAGYMVNFFRWFGVPETPFGTPYYNVFALLTQVSTASVWMRLPALLLAITTWFVISREVVPRLGIAARSSKTALWTGALVFLAFWLPYNNGLRPEPAVALGVLLTWCSVERAIATRRLLPAAAAILIAGFTVTAGPSGLICFAPLIAGARPIVLSLIAAGKRFGYLPVLGPLIASGSVLLVPVFADQPLSTIPVMQEAHVVAGPSIPWFQEYMRYQYLLQETIDGSPTRRFGVFVVVMALVVITAVILRKGGRIPGTSAGPSRRLVGVTVGAMVIMMFTPTKWTHHFGVLAGLGGSLAVLLAVAVAPAVMRSRRNRSLIVAGVAFLMALALTSRNGYWYPSDWGVPWFDKPPSISGFGISTVFRAVTVLALAAAFWFHISEPNARTGPARLRRLWHTSPLIVAAAFMVLFEVMSMAKATVSQYPAYSVGRSNIDALTGSPCGLADDVLVETDPNNSLLTPLDAAPAAALDAGGSSGFTPNGVPGDLTSEEEGNAAGTANSVTNNATSESTDNNSAGTGGGAGATGLNGSAVALPFGLLPSTTPVLGSFGTDAPASLTSGWYRLPAADSNGARGDLVSIAAAGRINSLDQDGVVTYGQSLLVEYGITAPNDTIAAAGTVTPIDIGPRPSWRNLRVPMADIPAAADVIRLVVADNDLDPEQWLAVTPPRVPVTTTLSELVGTTDPVLIDWAVGLNFPCQHLLELHDGVAQTPRYRILPDRPGAATTNLWQDHFGGGPLGWIDLMRSARTLPSYLSDDLRQDWGALEQYEPLDPSAVPAELETSTSTRSGLWSPGPMKLTS